MIAGIVFSLLAVLTAFFAFLSAMFSLWWLIPTVLFAALIGVGVHDLTQRRLAVLHNYPVLGHMRYILETMRPMIQQYFVERNWDGRPFDADARRLIYDRAKGIRAEKSFGTELEVRQPGYEFLSQSLQPGNMPAREHRVTIGGPHCTQPYSASLFNISSMSFGALSVNAVLAMGTGAKLGGFLQETGEGGLSTYHLQTGADLMWEFGSGYFGCRTHDGHFDPQVFAQKAQLPQVKAISVKLSQGAKPGLGGVLPGSKVTPEIAEARGIEVGQTCVSPPSHSAFDSPAGLMRFIAQLRDLSGGKPVGFKLCVGMRRDVLAVCKAMIDTGITPDFIIVDGAEGGTGAAPLEYEDHVGMPLTEGLILVHNALVGSGLRTRLKLGAAGKITSGTDIVRRLIQGADFAQSARGMMMATGCIQAQRCHTNACPTGITTQNPRLTAGLDVEDKSRAVANFHEQTVDEVRQIISTLGVDSPDQLQHEMLNRRLSQTTTQSYAQFVQWLAPGQLLDSPPAEWAEDWEEATAERFGPGPVVDAVPHRYR